MIQLISKSAFSTVFAGPLVKANWLHSNQSKVKIVDGSWYMPQMNRNPFQEYQQNRIPGAVFFDIEKLSRQNTDLPHMVPPKEQFDRQVSELGISNDDQIVVYDGLNLFSACRVYWTFKYFGHKNISILDGVRIIIHKHIFQLHTQYNVELKILIFDTIIFFYQGLPAYIKAGYSLETTPPQPIKPSNYNSTVQHHLIRSKEQILQNIEDTKNGQMGEQIVDMRGSGRFLAQVPEPRAGLQSGHVPFAKNIPFSDLIDTNSGEMIEEDQIQDILRAKNIDVNNPIVGYCGSGVTACIFYVALEKICNQGVSQNKAVYDGSWSEYGLESLKLPIEK